MHNVGAYLAPSTLLCRIARPGELEAILAINQDELEFVRPEQPVDLFLIAEAGSKRLSTIEHISQQEMQAAPKNLTLKSGGDMATRTDETGMERPVDVTYQASAPLSDTSGMLLPGSTGHAKIHAGYQPLYRRLWRTACRTFHFQM